MISIDKKMDREALKRVIKEVIDDPAVRRILFKDEKKAVTPPWMGSDEKLAADDILRLAAAGYVFIWNSAKHISHKKNATPPKVDMENIIRTVKQQPSKLGACLLGKLERIQGHFPDTVPDEIGYRIDEGSTTEQDIWKLSRALVEAVYEGEGTPSRKRAVVPPWKNPDEKAAADDIFQLARAGLAFDGERIAFVRSTDVPIPQIDFSNLLRVVEERPSKLAALLFDKIERLSGFYPGGTLGRLPGKRVDSICQGIKEGTTTKQDINTLSQTLIGAIMESME